MSFGQTPVYTQVHAFPSNPGPRGGYWPQGFDPQGPLLLASDGNFYGTTMSGGDDGGQCNGTVSGQHACGGTIFRVTPGGQFTLLHTFAWGNISAPYADGASPNGGLLEAPDGYLYGTTQFGGNGSTQQPTAGAGVIYRISKNGDFQVLHRFCIDSACTEGKFVSPLILGRDGKFYGTARDGAPAKGGRNGTIFRADTQGNVETLHNMEALVDGATPLGPLVQASDCNFYGTNSISGPNANTQGTVFRMTPSGDLTVIHSFTVGTGDGTMPKGALLQASNGKLYGITSVGGVNRDGVIYEVSLDGTYRRIYDVQGQIPGLSVSQLIQASDGNLWLAGGLTTQYNAFAVSTDGQLVRTVTLTCAQTNALPPTGSFVQSPDGKLWWASGAGPCISTTQAGTVVSADFGLPKIAQPTVAAVTNGASFVRGSLVPGGIATLFGTNLTSADGINLASALPLPNTLVNSTVLVNGCAATPLIAVDNVNGSQQINFQVPWEVAGQQTVAVQVVNNGAISPPMDVAVLGSQPGVFTYVVGTNLFGTFLHADYSIADTPHPAAPGETLLMYLTGMGAASIPEVDGTAANGETTVAMPSVTIGGLPAMVAYSGLAPGFVGLNQINVQVPAGLPSGNQPVVVMVGDQTSNSVLLPVK